MKKFIFSLIAALITTTPAIAAPFLVCDPYPANDPSKAVPTQFVVTIQGKAPVTTPAINYDGSSVYMHLDLGPLNLSGQQSVTAVAQNAWGSSQPSSPFVFTAGAPSSPGTLKLSVQ